MALAIRSYFAVERNVSRWIIYVMSTCRFFSLVSSLMIVYSLIILLLRLKLKKKCCSIIVAFLIWYKINLPCIIFISIYICLFVFVLFMYSQSIRHHLKSLLTSMETSWATSPLLRRTSATIQGNIGSEWNVSKRTAPKYKHPL